MTFQGILRVTGYTRPGPPDGLTTRQITQLPAVVFAGIRQPDGLSEDEAHLRVRNRGNYPLPALPEGLAYCTLPASHASCGIPD